MREKPCMHFRPNPDEVHNCVICGWLEYDHKSSEELYQEWLEATEGKVPRDKRTQEEVLSLGGELMDDGYNGLPADKIPREIMHARFLEHHARSRKLYGGNGPDTEVVIDLLYGAAKEIRDLYAKLEEGKNV